MVAQLQLKLINKTKIYIMKKSNDETFNATIGNTVLCDGFLIPMTDFVLEQTKNFNAVVYDDLETASINLIERIENYANFQKQPLKLEMFVPCDNDGNILEEPTNYEKRLSNMMTEYNDEVYTYNQAKEKVLFEGFELKEIGSICAPNKLVIGEFDDFEKSVKFYYSMEKLAEYKVFQLSQTALNAIFGKTVA